MDRERVDFFQTSFDSLKREMHQEFEHVNARLDRMEERADELGVERDRRLDALEERLRRLENGKAQ